jgi:hypothetical protein
MATGTGHFYGKAPLAWFNKEVDLLDDSIYVALSASAHTPDLDTHDYFNDVTNESSGTGYTAGGQQIANDTLGYTAGTNTLKYDGDDAAWTTSTIADAEQAHVYDRTPATDATRPLLSYLQFDAMVSTSAGTLTIQWDTDGIFELVTT